MKLRIDPSAEAELREDAAWYEEQRSGLGSEFLAAVDAGIQQIRRDPYRFARIESVPDEENVRRLQLNRFPYIIIYEVISSEVCILAVAHAHRRPGYWRDRRRDG